MKRILTLLCALALIAVSLLAVMLNTWLNAKSDQLVNAEYQINELTSIIERLNNDAELSDTLNARLKSDLEECQSTLPLNEQVISALTDELEAARAEAAAAREALAASQSGGMNVLSRPDTENADESAETENEQGAYIEDEIKTAAAEATAPPDSGMATEPPNAQAIDAAIETAQADIDKLSARLESGFAVKGVQAVVAEAIAAAQSTLDELTAQRDNASLGEDTRAMLEEAIASTQASIDNLITRLDNSFTVRGVQAAAAETIASTQAILDKVISQLES